MIGHFPACRPDELFYSLLARCNDRWGFKHNRVLLRLLSGLRNYKPKVDFPGHLEWVSSQIPCRILGSGADIANNLTLLPLFGPFLDPKIFQRVTDGMAGQKARAVCALTPLLIARPARLRRCAQCWREDVEAGYERYWRRSHQASGVLVCHLHEQFLADTSVEILRPASIQLLVSADKAATRPTKNLDSSNLDQTVLTRIASGVAWLLQQRDLKIDHGRLREAYWQALSQRGFVRGRVLNLREACRFVENGVGLALLREFDSELTNAEHNWLSQIMRTSARSSQAPLRHFILMAALGHDAKSFFSVMTNMAPEKEAIPPSLPILKPSICELRRLDLEMWWGNEEFSVCEMARRLGVAPGTIGLFATKNGFPFPRRCKTGVIGKRMLSVPASRPRMEQYRRDYLKMRRRYPNLSQTEIAGRRGAVVAWLRENDLAWLKANRAVAHQKGGNPGVDWKKRDLECSRKIPAIIKRLKSCQVPLSLSSIGRELRMNLTNQHSQLPKTDALCAPLLNVKCGRKKIS